MRRNRRPGGADGRHATRDHDGELPRLSSATNVFSLAEAKADGVSNPLAIYAGEQMVGFIMYDFEPKEDRGYLSRLMIDARFQRNGYGRAALTQVLDRLKAIPACREIRTSFAPGNVAAEGLYLSLGFEPTGETVDEEIVVRMRVRP
jgi:diamine N-acetyltransferase